MLLAIFFFSMTQSGSWNLGHVKPWKKQPKNNFSHGDISNT